ncbi:hypothetical protein NL108_018527 [Boleophthalmus pectinirostris]|nr:hypothetical protein NL108_018527 [Boleophthalmus pectinirostris]
MEHSKDKTVTSPRRPAAGDKRCTRKVPQCSFNRKSSVLIPTEFLCFLGFFCFFFYVCVFFCKCFDSRTGPSAAARVTPRTGCVLCPRARWKRASNCQPLVLLLSDCCAHRLPKCPWRLTPLHHIPLK